MSCNICVENFNKTTHKPISCNFCNFDACKSCWKTFFLENLKDPHCMNCNKQWTRHMLCENLGSNFVNNAFKKHRENMLFEREKALMPATQVHVEREIALENINDEITKHLIEIDRLKRQEQELHHSCDLQVSKKHYVWKCSFDNCRGFLSNDWKCGLCQHTTCKHCREIVFENHKCNPQTVESVKLLVTDTKPCPGCGTGIFKTEGCSQMFCTQCHTVFDWKTGNLETGTIHNPEYFEYMRNNQGPLDRPIGEIICGREIDHFFVQHVHAVVKNNKHKSDISNICQKIIHLSRVELPLYTVDRISNNLDLRIKYLRNIISEEKFKQLIQQREKKLQKKTEMAIVLNTFITCSTEMLYRFVHNYQQEPSVNNLIVNDNDKKQVFQNFISEMNELRLYINDCLNNVSKTFNAIAYHLDSFYNFCSTN